MKKLITISAILATSMFAISAHAEGITAGGSYSFEAHMGGADNASDAMVFSGGSYDFFLNVEKITDSELILIGATTLEGANSGEAALWDESTGAIIGDFGTITFSNDGGSVVSMAPGANGVSASGDVGDFIKLNGETTAGDRGVDPPDGGNTISYNSPNFSGFKTGITLGRNGGRSKIDLSEQDVTITKTEYTNGDVAARYSIPDDTNTEYMGVAVSYSSGGATIGYAIGTATSTIHVKGIKNTVDETDDDGFNEAILNGKYQDVWGGVKTSIRYNAGALTVGYSTTVAGVKDRFVASKKIPTPTDEGTLANLKTNERVLGVSYNYGDGTVSYVTASEDYSKQGDAETAETLTTNLIAVSHSLADGLSLYFENHTGSIDIDNSNDEYESVSENVIGIRITF